MDDLPEGASPFEILRAVDQKAGDDVDPDEVVQKLRQIDATVDQKLADIDGDGVDQKEMRDAAGAVASQTSLSTEDAMSLLSATVNASEQQDSSALVDAFDDVHSTTAGAGVDQNGGAHEPDSDADTNTNPTQMSDNQPNGGTDIDQKQTDNDQMDPIDLVEEIGGSDARDVVENYAESVNKDVQDAAAEWVAENVPGVTVEGYGSDNGSDNGAANANNGTPADQNGQTAAPDQTNVDQMLEDLNLNERVADAVTSDAVIDEMADAVAPAVAQKMTDDDELADQLVQTVDQKGDFATTGQTTTPAPGNESETVGESGAITGGEGE
ncbi:hypothetical protein C453_12936 [Haloferax elongans ATCC BAA-1513]|uniref:Uncharacterized protein n=1 Tax=Haloferax elongans ATCC BAA-1513 TaxID=1230453 RepID=M0HL59_HALEO|nr:hypothetical protein C453_12936 [Haloferax elongans ATCC BAA-1513]